MAPEHARGEAVDARADQFSIAVVAYEMLSGARYYAGLSGEQIWQQAGPGQFKPAGISDLPKGLREVIERALSPSRDDRYESCGDFREALLAYARKQDLHAGARELRTLMAELFVDDLQQTRELLQRFASANPNNFLTGDTSVDGDVYSIVSSPGKTTFHDPTELVRASGAFPIAPGPSSKAPIVVLAGTIVAAIVVAGIGLFIALHDSGPPPIATGPAWEPPPIASTPNPTVPTTTTPATTTPTTTTPTSTTPTTTTPTTTTPTTTTPTSATPANSGVDNPPDPTPASSSSSGGSSSHRRNNRHDDKHETSTPKKETALTFMDELAYVKRTCPDLACTQASKQKVEGLANASIEDVAAFKKNLHSCYDGCKASHGK
jgi:hypothetical protein